MPVNPLTPPVRKWISPSLSPQSSSVIWQRTSKTCVWQGWSQSVRRSWQQDGNRCVSETSPGMCVCVCYEKWEMGDRVGICTCSLLPTSFSSSSDFSSPVYIPLTSVLRPTLFRHLHKLSSTIVVTILDISVWLFGSAAALIFIYLVLDLIFPPWGFQHSSGWMDLAIK